MFILVKQKLVALLTNTKCLKLPSSSTPSTADFNLTIFYIYYVKR